MHRSLIATFLAITLATSATADTGLSFGGSVDKLIPISPTNFPGANGNRVLCARVTDKHLFFIPVLRRSHDYVLSETSCTTDEFYTIPKTRVTMFKSAGIIPMTVPDVPAPPLPLNARNLTFYGLGALLVIGFPMMLRRRMNVTSQQLARVSGDPMFYDLLLTLMFHTARKDGLIEKDELQVILRAYKELTGATVTPETTAEKFAQILRDKAMLNLVKGYSGPEAELLLAGAISVATHTGTIPREKMQLLKDLNAVLERDQGWFRQTLDAALRPKRPQTAI